MSGPETKPELRLRPPAAPAFSLVIPPDGSRYHQTLMIPDARVRLPYNDSMAVMATRTDLMQRGERVEYFTIIWNSIEGLISVGAGIAAGSVALVGFGLDSFIEVASGSALLWRMKTDQNTVARERAERISLRIVGFCFLALAAYVSFDSLLSILRRRVPDRSVLGIAIGIASLLVMPLLAQPSAG